MDAATRLRAQKACSTDPDYLERMALAEEVRERETLWGLQYPSEGARQPNFQLSSTSRYDGGK
jgi:hypothetical protein